MKTQSRLFLAGSVGAVIGGSLVAHLTHLAGASGLFFTLIGIILGCLTASFVYDPSGAKASLREAAIKAFPNVSLLLNLVIVFLGALVLLFTRLGLIIGVRLLGTVICSCTWYPIVWVWGQIDGNILYNAILISFFPGVLITFFCFDFATTKDLDEIGLVENVMVTLKAIGLANPVYLAYKTLRGVIWTAGHVKSVIQAVLFFFLLLTFGLARCRRRSAAMVGAGIGTILGLFFSNPLILGLAGGVVAVVAHFPATFHRWKILRVLVTLRPAWRIS